MAAPIGREREFGALRSAADEGGAIVFLAGATGSGKSYLLRALGEELRAEDTEVVAVHCYETSAGNPLGPLGEVLRALTSRERRSDRAKRILELVGQVAPPLVELIPVIGKLAALGVKAAADAGVYALGGDHEAQQAELAADVALALRKVAEEIPLAVMIDDAHWIDAPSTEVILRLADDAAAGGPLVVVAYDDDLVDDRHALARLRSALVGRAAVRRVAVEGFGREGLEAVLADRYGGMPGPRLADWLLERTDGSPLYVEQYLATLEERGVLRFAEGGWSVDEAALAAAETPETLLDLLRPRVADLDEEDRTLLETGAVQGRRFLSTVLVKLLEREEDEILDRLGRLEERSRMIVVEDGEDWWSDRSNLYAFDPGVLRELLYGRYARSAYERRRRHRAVAAALEALIAEDDPPPRHALLEIAQHYEDAGDEAAAARRLVEVAESTWAEGADRETAANAERAVALLRKTDGGDDVARLLARAVALAVLAGESRGAPRLLEMVEAGKAAADETGDAALRANARYASGLVLVEQRGLQESIAEFREALPLAREAGDALGEVAILISLGHHLNSVSLEEGWAVLQEALALLEGGALAERLDDAAIARETTRVQMMVGVAAFDLGRYGEALGPLVSSAEALRGGRRRHDAGWAMAFLGQLYAAIGLFEAAEATLREGIALYAGDEAPQGVRAYLTAFLGHLYLEWDPPRLDDARSALEAGRAEARAANYRSIEPLVDAYRAEGLLADGAPAEAEALPAGGETFGWARAEILFASLRARAALALGRVNDAARWSGEAVERLADCGGTVTAVRPEEILLTHARVLEAAGSAGEAARYAAEAAAVVRAKAASLGDPAHRDAYLGRVRVSREVLALAGAEAATG